MAARVCSSWYSSGGAGASACPTCACWPEGSSGKSDLKRHGVIGRFLRRQFDFETPGVLRPLELSFVAQQFDIANPGHAVLAAKGERGNRSLFARPAHDECVQRVALGGEARIFGSQILALVFVESLPGAAVGLLPGPSPEIFHGRVP